MQNSKTFVLGEHTYTIKMFSPTRATKIFAKLVKLIGPSLAVMADAKGNEGKEGEMLSKALMALGQNLREDEFEMQLKELLSGVIYNGQTLDVQYDIHFSGGVMNAFVLAGEVVKFNFKDFLSVLPGGKNLLAVGEQV